MQVWIVDESPLVADFLLMRRNRWFPTWLTPRVANLIYNVYKNFVIDISGNISLKYLSLIDWKLSFSRCARSEVVIAMIACFCSGVKSGVLPRPSFVLYTDG